MIYTMTVCFGVFLSICGQVRQYDYPNLAECEKAKSSLSAKAIGDGYAICHPKHQLKEKNDGTR